MFELIFLVILILLSGFFSGSEVALVGIRESKVKTLLKDKKRGSRPLNRLKNHPKRMLITILIGNNIVNIAASSIVAVIITNKFGSIGLGIATGLMTIIILIAGEIIPKTFSSSHTTGVALFVAPIIEFLSIILYPIVWSLDKLAITVNNLVKIKHTDKFDESEVMSVLDIAYEQKVLDENIKGLMENSLKFGKINIGKIMTPINQIYSLDANLQIKDVLDDVIESGYSRIPVYKKETSNIIGIILVKDILRELKDNNGVKKLEEISIEPSYIESHTFADDLLEYFKSRHEQFGLVKEENKIIGIISIEDVLEELVGEITDESDITPIKFLIVNKKRIIAHPLTELRIINSFFNKSIEFDKDEITIEDFIKKNINDLSPGSSFTLQNLEFRIHELDKNGNIKLVMVINKTIDDYLTQAIRDVIPRKNNISFDQK